MRWESRWRGSSSARASSTTWTCWGGDWKTGPRAGTSSWPRTLLVPPELAHGDRGFAREEGWRARAIGPSETLVLELELLAIRPPAGAAPQAATVKAPAAVKDY